MIQGEAGCGPPAENVVASRKRVMDESFRVARNYFQFLKPGPGFTFCMRVQCI
jgi:hypothetical protein